MVKNICERIRLKNKNHFFPLISIFILLLQTILSVTSKNLNLIFQEYSSSNKFNVYSTLLETRLLDRAM